MTRRVLVASTPTGSLRPLAFQGAPVTHSRAQLSRLLAQRLGPAHAALFAEPLADPKRDAVDWYAHVPGDAAGEAVTPLSDADAQAQDRAREALGLMAADIANLARELADSGDRDQASIGRVLELALHFPGEANIHLVGAQPVVVCWGHAGGGSAGQGDRLTRYAQVRATDAPPPVTPGPRGPLAGPAAALAPPYPWWMFLIWFLIGVLLALALLLLMDRLRPAVDRSAALDAERAYLAARREESALRQELMWLTTQWFERRLACERAEPEPEPEPVVEPEPEPEPEVVEPEPEPEPVIEPEPEPEPEPVIEPEPEPQAVDSFEPGELMHIPEQAEQRNDLSFLDGCWQSTPFRHTADQREPGVSVYCFNELGWGGLTWSRSDATCQTPARAQFLPGGGMRIVDTDTTCSDGSRWYADHVDCENQGGVAVCQGWYQEPTGQVFRWNYTLRKIR